MRRIVGYTRVSTSRQGASGLGLEAQLAAIHAYAAQSGSEVVAVYQEVESGRVSDRPELAKALAHAKKVKGALAVAKLDRLARSVAFVSQVMESGVDFVACDNPHANRLLLHVLSAIAEHEAGMIAERTRAALQAAKMRGVRLGSPVAAETAALAREARTVKAKAKAANVLPIIESIERAGVSTLTGIAKALEARGVLTPNGGATWQAGQVARIKAMAA